MIYFGARISLKTQKEWFIIQYKNKCYCDLDNKKRVECGWNGFLEEVRMEIQIRKYKNTKIRGIIVLGQTVMEVTEKEATEMVLAYVSN